MLGSLEIRVRQREDDVYQINHQYSHKQQHGCLTHAPIPKDPSVHIVVQYTREAEIESAY